MQVKQVMSKNPDALSDDTTLKQAAIEMKKHDFGFLPIRHDGEIVGVVTDRDLVIRALANGLDYSTASLKEVMTKELYYCNEEDDIKQVAEIMSKKKVNRLVVYNDKKELTGIISAGDVARKCKDTALCGKIFESIHQE